ncbi:uncharacterized protein LOC135696274 [Rhopilema esculentum]|uniref:uncharacterized protein LOC135696274 n=1 Tax=Rhopilema esculentum TaxID=499914 RepID=UPI0031DDD79C|eukprot:gene5019-127_t
MEVCALLCCEIEQCDTAWVDNNVCYSVSCKNHACETEKATGKHANSAVVQFKRKYQNSTPNKETAKVAVTGVKYDENKSTIVTKQAVTSINGKPEKSSSAVGATDMEQAEKKQEALVTISSQSPMEQLLQSEASIIHNKATVEETASKKTTQEEATKKKSDVDISTNIQSLSEHLKKADEKADITAALEENDKRTIHPKLRYHKHHDLRHNLISPIIIGAFTCMAVIALSGFAMAIIKYQKERKEKHSSQSTQTFDSS